MRQNFKAAERERAVERGLEFLYRIACEPQHFDIYGFDLLFCFYCISKTSLDPKLRATARKMGRERARRWRSENRTVPPDVDANGVFHFAFGGLAADKLGVRDPSLKPQVREAAQRFTAEDFFCFDPLKEAPPVYVSEECERERENERGRANHAGCRKRLETVGRYGVWNDALIRSYVGERYGVVLGAPYAEVVKWQPLMRPYRGREGSDNRDFYWTVYAVTHIVYTLNDYSSYRLDPEWLPTEFAFLQENLREAQAIVDAEMMGEFLDALKVFGLTYEHPLLREGTEFVLSLQNADGSWGNTEASDVYQRYHPTYTALNGLRDYAARDERLSFPGLKPLLQSWAGKN